MGEMTAFQAALQRNRDRLNAAFAAARHTQGALDPAVTLEQLRVLIGPIIAAAAQAPAAAADTIDRMLVELFDLLLQLLPAGVVGPETRSPFIVETWRSLLPALPRQLAEAPRRVAAALTNAGYNLSAIRGARPEHWLATMHRAAPYCPDVAALLSAGQVSAWLAGVAHYRTAALELCSAMDPPLLEALFAVSGDRPPSAYASAVGRMAADPWLPLRAALSGPVPGTSPRLRLTHRAGGFRGFGGEMLAPPLVTYTDGAFYVQDGAAWWRLYADIFGATLVRAGAPSPPRGADASRAALASPWSVSPGGSVTWGKQRETFAEAAEVRNWAADGQTLVVTSHLSHYVFIFGLVTEGAA